MGHLGRALAIAGLALGLVWSPPARAAGSGLVEAFDALDRCDPAVAEARARLDVAEAERDRARQRWLWELRGSYFYYPDATLSGPEGKLRDIQQRADLYLRYPLLGRLWRRPDDLARRQSQVEEARAAYEDVATEGRRRVAVAYATYTRATTLAARLQPLVERARGEHARLRTLWQDKIVLLERVLEARQRLEELETRNARLDTERDRARRTVAGLVCTPGWSPESLGVGPVVFPFPDTVPGEPGDRWRERARRTGLEAQQPLPGTRLDLEAGYTWEEDKVDGLVGGSRFGIRFSVPLDGLRPGSGREGLARARARVWEARARAEALGQRETRARWWDEVDELVRRLDRLDTRDRLQAERLRVARLTGGNLPDRGSAAEARWEIYFRALELRADLFPDGPPTPPPTPYAVFTPPDEGRPATRKTPPRDVYLWGGPEAAGDLDLLLAFCRAKGITGLYVSPGRRPLLPFDRGWTTLLARARAEGVRVLLLLGENGWARPGRTAGLDERLAEYEVFQKASPVALDGIHLDVEPHVLPGWADDPQPLVAGLAEVVTRARKTLDRGTRPASLEVALPVWFPRKVGAAALGAVTRGADRVVWMAYEAQRDPGEPLFATGAAASVALRADDYPDEGALERAVDRWRLAAAPDRVAVHDFAAWRRLADALPQE